MRDIAKQAGCDQSTVSLALRRHASIPKSTSDRIARIAQKMGYRPNPLLSAWMANVRLRRSGYYKATLAYLDDPIWHDPLMLPYFHGAERRAYELGYKLSYFWLREPGMTVRRMDRILNNSGIRGIVIGPLHSPRGHLSLTWNKLAAVSIGHSMLRPQLHRVAHHQFHGIQTALRSIIKGGYRRIGLIVSPAIDARTDYHYSSGMSRFWQTIPPRERIPIHYFTESDVDMKRWHARWKPECVISHYQVLVRLVGLIGAGVGTVDLDLLPQSVKGSAGIDQQYERIGAIAVDLVCSDLSINRIGIPETPLTVLVEGRWANGSTLPSLKRHPAKVAS